MSFRNIIIDNFYARLSFQDKTLLDTTCSGSFTNNKEEFKRDLLDRIKENAEDWENDKGKESGYADKPPFKPLPPKEGNEEKEEKKKKKKKERRRRRRRRRIKRKRETCCCSTNLCTWRPNTVYKNRSTRRHQASSSSAAVGNPFSPDVSEKLTPENFLVWKVVVLPAVCGVRLIGYLDGTIEAHPEEITIEKTYGAGKMVPEKVENPAFVMCNEKD
ncbi:hypothetical protein QYE76_062032 [Lolium multiflorum]|uniref:Uncharacterized protein n=1 Tax=Lolium multiflorum TaxID=4521 RepID=A0AAD8S2F0_LOLMU|nr:hypothetical protein QYE76_062032 [Lolium multiflorum]